MGPGSRQLVPKTTRTQDNSYPRQLVPRTTRTQDNSYPGQLVPMTTRTLPFGYITREDDGNQLITRLLSGVPVVQVTSRLGYEFSWVRVVPGMSCLGYELSWVRVVLGTSCPGYELSRVQLVLGTSCLGYELSIIPWGPPGADGTQVGPMLAPRILLSGKCCQVMRMQSDH